ncbi:hypothetical protein F5887DRAFT_272036 [Amanita rubescens]|nr:hypothetical protein F5887DRAFT_272036 [Amanita rubescens]
MLSLSLCQVFSQRVLLLYFSCIPLYVVARNDSLFDSIVDRLIDIALHAIVIEYMNDILKGPHHITESWQRSQRRVVCPCPIVIKVVG